MKNVKQCLAAFLIAFLSVIILGLIGEMASARADSDDMGCERIRWGFLASGYRTICDGPKMADGSWTRVRREWTPAHWVPVSCSRYSCFGGYPVDESTQRFDTYTVFDHNIVPGEPGHLPSGAVFIR